MPAFNVFVFKIYHHELKLLYIDKCYGYILGYRGQFEGERH